MRAAQSKGELAVRELVQVVNREVKRVHEGIVNLAELGLLQRTKSEGAMFPCTSMHIDMYLRAA